MTYALMPITRTGRSDDNSCRIASKMKRIESQSFLQLWPIPSRHHRQYFQHTLYLSITAIQRKKLALLAVDDHTNRKILTQQINGHCRSNRHPIFFRRMFSLASLHQLMQIEKNPD